MDLIDELEAEHRAIVAHLEAIKEARFNRETSAKELAKAKALIVAHLAKEDEKLYKPLLAHTDAQATAKQFQDRMQAITVDVLAFFAKYDLNQVQELGLDFVRDLGVLVGKLKTRIAQEEERLYVLYRQTVA